MTIKIYFAALIFHSLLPFSNFQTGSKKIEFQEISIFCTQTKGPYLIINTLAEYKQLMHQTSPHPDCGTYELPDLDFNLNTLVYIHKDVGGLPPKVNLSLWKNRQTGQLKIDLNIQKYGIERNAQFVTKWLLFEKTETEKIEVDIKIKQ